MDVTNLILNLKSTITNNALDQQMVSKAIKQLELGAVISVESFANLPSPVGNSGKLYYVEYDGLYWSTGEYWVPIVNTTIDAAWAWGSNGIARLGDDTIVDRSSPVSVVGGFADWCQASAGGRHSLGVRSNGSLWAWGLNGNGQLGNNTVTTRSSPVSVVGGFTNWCQASAGLCHSLGVRSNGSVWAWGMNSSGQLGDGTLISKNSPISVVGGFTDWCQASAGFYNSLGVRSNCSLWAWGNNNFGRLGDNTTIDKNSPVSVVGGFTDWCQASAGRDHSLAVRTNGSVWAWGNAAAGRLGDNTAITKSSPVSVVGGFTDWCQASAGFFHSLGVRSNGSLWAWGCNAQGRLGDGTVANRSSPVSVVGGFTDWCQASAAGYHSLGVRSNGSLWAWGCNTAGRLGDDTTADRSSPVSVVGGFTGWCQASASFCHSLAIRSVPL